MAVGSYLKAQGKFWVERAASVVTPLPPTGHGYRSPVVDARRFALLMCLISVAAGYAYVDESTRRTVRSTTLHFDRIFQAHNDMNNALQSGSLSQSEELQRGGPAVQESPLTDSLRFAGYTGAELVSRVSSGAPFCNVRHYRVALPDGWRVETDGDYLHRATTVGASSVLYHLMEFPPSCHVEGHRTTYALVGFFAHGEEQFQPGVLFDSGGILLYGENSTLEERFLAMASRVTGRYYSDTGYDAALADLLSTAGSSTAPTFFGVPIPMGQVVIALPLALLLLAVSFFHRVRRIHDAREPIWLLSHSQGCIEKTIAALWRIALLLSGWIVYVAANLHLNPSVEVQEARAAQFAFAPERGGIVRTLWEPTDIGWYYAVAMCGLATLVNALSIVALAYASANSGRGSPRSVVESRWRLFGRLVFG